MTGWIKAIALSRKHVRRTVRQAMAFVQLDG
jgi:hypothetical protein